MRRLPAVLSLLCFLPFFARAQAPDGVLHVSKDSIPLEMTGKYWRFYPADLRNGADTALEDRNWTLTSSKLRVISDSAAAKHFSGICWMRLHLYVDSPAAARPLALRIKQHGASEIYVDGKLLRRYGYLSPKDSAEYINPQEQPLSLPTLNVGSHIIAVRYANWDYKRYSYTYRGFTAGLWTAEAALESYSMQHTGLVVFVLLFGIFITLAIVHLILYLYYRAERANAVFALFSACLATLLLIPAVTRISEDARFIMRLNNAAMYMLAAVSCSLSLLLNQLFSKRRWHFFVSVAACALLVVITAFEPAMSGVGLIAVCVIVPLEALYILVGAMLRRLPGARIIGSGLVLLILLLLTVMGFVLIKGDFILNENTIIGQIFLLVLVLAILSIPISMNMYLAWRFSRLSRDLKTQLVQVEDLSARTRQQETEKQRLLENRQEELEREVAERTASLRDEKEKSDTLLRNILPEEVAAELKETGSSEARLYNNVSVLFTDFVNFTQIAETLSPAALVAEIHHCFKAFDGIIEMHGLEKIKTVGDAYIAVSGMPVANPAHAENVVAAALEIRSYMQSRKSEHPASFAIRLGVHSGPVVAGIVGVKKFAYDIWGDTVNTAARMEQHSEPGGLNISAATYELVKDSFRCTYRGELEAKHKGKLGMYFVESAVGAAV